MHPFFLSNTSPLKPIDRYANPYHGTEVLRFAKVTADDYERYCTALETAGFTLYCRRVLAQNQFATYTTPLFSAHLAFYPALGEMRVTHGAHTYLPPLEAKQTEHVQSPTLTQIKLSNIGQSNIVQLSDGSFLIIDGGVDNEEDRACLLSFLLTKKPEHHPKPRISAWLISHAHNDHIHLCQEFLKAYADRVEVELFGYNFPDFTGDIAIFIKEGQQGRTIRWQNQMRDIINQHFPLAKRWEPHSGQTLHLPGCDVDVLIAFEDYWPHEMSGVNPSSCCFRLRFESGKTAMIPTDAWFGSCDQMALVYGDELKSDILQAVHHGTAGGTIPFYERVAPEVVLWEYPVTPPSAKPTDAKLHLEFFDVVRNKYPYSAWLLEHATRHYHSGETITIDTQTLELLS